MKVSLLYATPGAADILIYTKNTRLNMSPQGLAEIREWAPERKDAELAYMAKTIPSSWEFVDLIFCIEGVTRAFTHQFVRTRTASYAQQTMRVINMGDFDYYTGPTVSEGEAKEEYDHAMESISASYKLLIEAGAKPEDARGILPTNIKTNICVKMNLRTLSDLVRKRSSGRVQGEYAEVLEQFIALTLKEWPWAEPFIVSQAREAQMDLTRYLQRAMAAEMAATGKAQNETEAWNAMKNLDLVIQE